MAAPLHIAPEADPDERDASLGWLCPTEAHRARMLDMTVRVERARNIAMAAVGVGLFASIGQLGWRVFVLFGIAVLNVATLEPRIRRSSRPERVVASSLLFMGLLIAAGVAMSGAGTSPGLAWLVIPVAVTAVRFRAHVVWAAAGVAGFVAVAIAIGDGVQKVVDHPLSLTAALVLLVGVTAVTTGLMDAELQYRQDSVLDPLTGLLNRGALEARFAEVAEQARVLERPVCIVMCDLDNFKTVNDDHGHERGDVVLREVSAQMRESLRSFELFYRLGGEEFLVLLPGIDLPMGIQIAESLRGVVADGKPGGVPITASLGVSAATGDGIDFVSLYRAADEALYRAKDGGRNLVAAAGLPHSAAPVVAPISGSASQRSLAR